MKNEHDAQEWNASAYHQLSESLNDWACTLLQTQAIREDETVVDAGCGPGNSIKMLLERVPSGRVVGVDSSRNMLAFAKKAVRPQPGQNVEFIEADLCSFFGNSFADGVFSSMAMEYVQRRNEAFRNFSRVLKPGGWVAAQFGASQPRHAVLFPTIKQLAEEAPFNEYFGNAWCPTYYGGHVEETEDQLRRAGFVDIDVRLGHSEVKFANRETFSDFLRTMVLYEPLNALPTSTMRNEFLKVALDRIDAEWWDDGFSFVVCRARVAT